LELREAGKKINDTSLEEMDEIWNRIKRSESRDS